MKVRSGFVSNSSSSSFIISIFEEKNKPCPHCGREYPDLIKLIERDEEKGWGDTSLSKATKETLIEEYYLHLKRTQEQYNSVKDLPDNEVIFSGRWSKITAKQEKEWRKAEISSYTYILNKLKSTKGKVYSIELDYHTEVRQIMADMVGKGVIEIIYDSEN